MITSGLKTGFGDEWIRLGATSEHTVDGSFSERTMALSVPYLGVGPPYTGNITETQDDLNAWIERVHRAGIQTNCHANGDVAIGMVLTAVERAQKLFPRADSRPKITHCTLINDDLLRRMKATGTVPAVFTTYAYYNTDKFHFYGEELMKRSHGVSIVARRRRSRRGRLGLQPRTVRAADGHSGHGDAQGMGRQSRGASISGSASTRRCGSTRSTAPTPQREEAIKGSITPGKLADFVVLAEDLHTVEQDKIKDITDRPHRCRRNDRLSGVSPF